MKTKILIEHYAGDTMKIVAYQLDDLFTRDRLQTDEINSIVKTKILNSKLTSNKQEKRPKSSKKFESNYNSGNEYTRTKSYHEKKMSDRLEVIEHCFIQMKSCDGITKEEFISLCESYVRVHFDDGEDVTHIMPSRP